MPIAGPRLLCVSFVVLAAHLVRAEGGPEFVASEVRPPALSEWTTRSFTLESAELEETRQVFVALPPSHARTSRAYPLVIALDGEWMFPNVLLAGEHLAATGQMPEFVLAGVTNTHREENFTPPGVAIPGVRAGGDAFLRFLDTELVPALERQFRAGQPIVLIGHSHSAMFAAWALSERPGRFDWAVGLDGPMHHANALVVRRLRERAERDPSPALRLVSLEARFAWPRTAWEELQGATPKHWLVQRETLASETHESIPLAGAYVGLQRIFDDFSYRHTRNARVEDVLARYAEVVAAYGADVPPPERVLNSALEDLLIESRPREAEALLTKLAAAYGAQPQHARIRARIEQVEDLPPPKETVASMLAAPRATASEIAPFVGRWSGADRLGDEVLSAVELRLRVVDGRAEGEFISRPVPDEELVMTLEYVVVTPGGLHFGYMNGMRPRGLLVYEMEMQDGRLTGEMQMRGVNFKPPAGMQRPKVITELRRAGD